MATILVTTTGDVVDANDGVISLREAVAASKGAGPTLIKFDTSVFDPAGTRLPLMLKNTLTITSGENIIIDGSLVFASQNLTISGSLFAKHMFEEQAGAIVTLRNLTLDGGTETGAHGIDRGMAANGTQGIPGAALGASGTNATDGANGIAGGDGGDAVGGILNAGTLTLERVTFNHMTALGGTGGFGESGGQGGNGGDGNGSNANSIAASGGNGGNSGSGGAGGHGGAAAGGILNTGALTLRDVQFKNLSVTGGHGGNGGTGATGGAGGIGWDTGFAGNGGNGGDGGAGGVGGLAATMVLNRGQLTIDGPIVGPLAVSASGGLGGIGLGGGLGGAGGFSILHHGLPGSHNGVTGAFGSAGPVSSFFGFQPSFALESFLVETPSTDLARTADIAHRTVFVAFERLGDLVGADNVHWTFHGGPGVTAADFVGGIPAGGTINFNSSQSGRFIPITVAKGGLIGPDKTFTITVENPNAGFVGWSNTTTVKITGADIAGGSGADILRGTDTDNGILAGAGNDKLFGGLGDDAMSGGRGKDILTGGLGADTFVYTSKLETPKGSGHDIITDFSHAQHDKIDLHLIDANLSKSKDQAFVFIGTQAFHNTVGELHYFKVDNPGKAHDFTMVEGDINGDGAADFQIELTGLRALAKADFIL